MFAMRAIPASRPLHEPAQRRDAAGTDPSENHAGFPAALEAAAEGIGKPAVAVPGIPPRPQSGQPGFRPLAAGRAAPADAFDILAAAADSLGLSATAGTGRAAPGPAGSAVPAVPEEGIAVARGDPPPGAPAVPVAANTGADPKGARPVSPQHVLPIPRVPAPAAGGAGAPKSPPAPAKGTSSAPAHASPHRDSVAAPAPPGIQAVVMTGVPGMIAAGLPAARPAARSDTADAAAATPGPPGNPGNPGDRLSLNLPAPLAGPGSRRPQETGSQPHPVPVAAVPPGGTNEGAGARRGPTQPAGSLGPATGSPAAASNRPPPQAATARVGEKPLPPSGGSVPAPDRPTSRGQEPAALVAGAVAYGANPPAATAAGAAGKAENAAPAQDAAPPRLAEQLSGQIVRAAANGHRDLALRLHPPDLGEVSVRLVVSGREVSAWFDSPQSRVQQAISQSMGELHADLATAGWDLSGAWVGGQAWTPRERTGSPPAPRPIRPAAGSAPAQEVRNPAPAAAGAGVSIYV